LFSFTHAPTPTPGPPPSSGAKAKVLRLVGRFPSNTPSTIHSVVSFSLLLHLTSHFFQHQLSLVTRVRYYSTYPFPLYSVFYYNHFLHCVLLITTFLPLYPPPTIKMSVVSLLGVNVLNNPAKFTDKYEFEITFECLEQLEKGSCFSPVLQKIIALTWIRSRVEAHLRWIRHQVRRSLTAIPHTASSNIFQRPV
jgi:hypothetical protein